MTIVPAGAPRDPLPDSRDDALIARVRRHKLTRLVAGVAGVLVAAAVVALMLAPTVRQRYLLTLALVLVLCGALPLLASLLQYLVLALHRFHTGYRDVRAYYPRVAIVVPAWNEADVIGTTITRLLAIDYPRDCLRVYVIDDGSTDATPDIVGAWANRHPDHVRHLRRDQGGQGKAHTLNYGISHILNEPWAEALLVIDADVLFEDNALRRMTRHLANPHVGAVTAYVKEGSAPGNYLTRFIAYEYITAQAASRRAQNVFGALACLAGGAQLHSRSNLEGIGGRIDTSSLAEDTITTFRTQLSGKGVVFDGNAVVWAEEPADLVGLWKQRLRWARGNVQISLQFSHMWLHGGEYGALGRVLFAYIWFTVLLVPVFMIAASFGLLGLYAIDASRGWEIARSLWILHAIVYIFVTAMSLMLDPSTAKRAWLQGCLFPGVVSLGIMIYSVAPGPIGDLLTNGVEQLGVAVTPQLTLAAKLLAGWWLAGSMLVAYIAKAIAARWPSSALPKLLIYVAGYGAFLCSVTVAAYVREWQGAQLTWDKTIKTGRVALPQ